MLQLEHKWVWDFWFAVDGSDYHMFYLQADKSLGNPDLRHWNVSIGHAVSQDLKHWKVLPDALAPTPNNDEAPDSFTTWTGCVIKHADEWIMYYTGTKRAERGLVQRVCMARSPDLIHWTTSADNPVTQLDERWYDGLKLEYWHDASWRDPWVVKDPHQNLYHMFITCRVNSGEPDGRGAVGYASSTDLNHWTVGEPFFAPGWFGEMEVPQIEKIGERYYLFCSVSKRFHSKAHLASAAYEPQTGVKYFVSDSMLGPYECVGNGFLTGPKQEGLYSGRLIKDAQGNWQLMAFMGNDSEGHFAGNIIDPIPVVQMPDGQLRLND
ncbi:family 43 glycosylhydrolase [Cellvibrio sp.]|uniref:family 43 glycosylhydrolase n=1 Tax=Cellvibrio sp. TaxID=1965322 RepID=UPI0039648935